MLSGQARKERPAGYRAVLASSEFRSLYAGSALSWVGDFAAKAAITAYVYQLTGSVAFSAASFAISFAPWLLGGYLLVVVAERHTYKRVMIACDLARMAVMALVALVDLPLLAILALLLVSALFTPPFEAARSEEPLPGDGAEPAPAARGRAPEGGVKTMADIEREAILSTLQKTGGRRVEAARLLDIGLRTLQRKLKEYKDQGRYEEPN